MFHVTNIYLNFSGFFLLTNLSCCGSSDKPILGSVVKSSRPTTPREICSVPTKV